MASRGIYLSLALAFALLLLNISCCTCLTVTWSDNSRILTEEEAKDVYRVLEIVANNTENDIVLNGDYHAGRIFSKYMYVNGKGVVIRLTRWSSQCSVSLDAPKTKGRELVDAFKLLLPKIKPYLLDNGYEWVAVSNLTYWIDYYVRETYASSAARILQPANGGANKVISEAEVNTEADCTIQPHMLLSHHSAHAFNQLYPGNALLSPNAKYKLTIPQSDPRAACVLKLEDKDDMIMWQSNPIVSAVAFPQINCSAAFRSDGTFELWNKNVRIWHNVSACSPLPKCAGAASLAVDDGGNVVLYRSVGNYLGVYWSAVNPN